MVKPKRVPMRIFTRGFLLVGLWGAVFCGLLTPMAQAGVHFTLQSSLSDNNLGLQFQNSRSASASVAFDLGTYFSIGVTHRQSLNHLEGYKYNQYAGSFDYIKEQTLVAVNSLDFNIILYYGELFVPYIQIGLAKKNYTIISELNNGEPSVAKFTTPIPVPNGGIGLGIRLNQNFSLKLSYLVSPGSRQMNPYLAGESVLDSYTSIGITYNI